MRERKLVIRKVKSTQTFFELVSTTDELAWLNSGHLPASETIRYPQGKSDEEVLEEWRLLTDSEAALYEGASHKHEEPI